MRLVVKKQGKEIKRKERRKKAWCNVPPSRFYYASYGKLSTRCMIALRSRVFFNPHLPPSFELFRFLKLQVIYRTLPYPPYYLFIIPYLHTSTRRKPPRYPRHLSLLSYSLISIVIAAMVSIPSSPSAPPIITTLYYPTILGRRRKTKLNENAVRPLPLRRPTPGNPPINLYMHIHPPDSPWNG